MSYKISKELFEEVMNVSLYDELYIDNDFDEYNCVEVEDWQIIKYNNTWIPLDTFVFKCKEWALFSRDIEIRSFKTKNIADGVYCLATSSKMQRTFKSSSEQQAVFDACQWILDNRDKQCE